MHLLCIRLPRGPLEAFFGWSSAVARVGRVRHLGDVQAERPRDQRPVSRRHCILTGPQTQSMHRTAVQSKTVGPGKRDIAGSTDTLESTRFSVPCSVHPSNGLFPASTCHYRPGTVLLPRQGDKKKRERGLNSGTATATSHQVVTASRCSS